MEDDVFINDIPEGLEFYDIRRQPLKKEDDDLEISVSQVSLTTTPLLCRNLPPHDKPKH